MPGYFALLRAINVGGHSALKMDALRKAFEAMGFSKVGTFIASGNVYFEARASGATALQRKIDRALTAGFGKPLKTFVRTARQLQAVAAYNPYKASEMKDADINIIFLDGRPQAAAIQRLKEISTRTDTLRAHGREVYWLRSKLPGRPDYASVPLDKALQAPFTVRRMRTVQKMVSRFASDTSRG